MSYEKYLKYKTKYLNLKAEIHNQKIIQNGGADDTSELNSLGSEPLSSNENNSFTQNGGAESSESNVSLETLGSSPASSDSHKNLT